jgi:deazaflavin-dependent oxidoreductase (nitroreductase family)
LISMNIFNVFRLLNRRMVKNYRRGFGPTHIVLLLTTTGRKSGLPRITPLQFEDLDGKIIIGSARGVESDWFKNILAEPHVHVQIKNTEFDAMAEPVTDNRRVTDFIELRVKRHPVLLRLIMLMADGLPPWFTREQLERYCANRAVVILHPLTQ